MSVDERDDNLRRIAEARQPTLLSALGGTVCRTSNTSELIAVHSRGLPPVGWRGVDLHLQSIGAPDVTGHCTSLSTPVLVPDALADCHGAE